MLSKMFGKLVSKDRSLVKADWSIRAEGQRQDSRSGFLPAHSDAFDGTSRIHTKTQSETSPQSQ